MVKIFKIFSFTQFPNSLSFIISFSFFLLIRITSVRFAFQKHGPQFLEKSRQNIYISKGTEKDSKFHQEGPLFPKSRSLTIPTSLLRGTGEVLGIGRKNRCASSVLAEICFVRQVVQVVLNLQDGCFYFLKELGNNLNGNPVIDLPIQLYYLQFAFFI